METNTGNEGALRKQWIEYLVFALMLVAGLFLLSIFGGRGESRRQPTQMDVSNIYAGDWNVKIYFFQRYAAELGVDIAAIAGGRSAQILPQALEMYKSAAHQPIAAAIRRAGILTYELQGEGAAAILDRLDSPEVLEGLLPQDRQRLQVEARMWQDIYTGELTAREVDDYAERIEGVSLGTVRAFALKHLYTRAGRDERAAEVLRVAAVNAAASVIPAVALMIILFIAGLAGVVFIFYFLSNRRRYLEHTRMRPDEGGVEDSRGMFPSSLLFLGFITYMGAIWLLSLFVAPIFLLKFENLPVETRMLYTAALEFGLSAFSGLIGLVVVYSIVRRAGGSLSSVGLTLRELPRNILWGIAGFCTLLPLLGAAVLISNLISRLFFRGVETPAHPIFPMLLAGDPTIFLLLFLIGTVLAPFFEEIFFRGLLYGGLRARLSVTWAVIISAAAFSIIHPQLPAGFIPIFAIGAVFAILVEIRRSLVPAMIAHALNNGVIFLMMYFAFIR